MTKGGGPAVDPDDLDMDVSGGNVIMVHQQIQATPAEPPPSK